MPRCLRRKEFWWFVLVTFVVHQSLKPLWSIQLRNRMLQKNLKSILQQLVRKFRRSSIHFDNFQTIFIGDWHVGRAPDKRALHTMKTHNLEYSNKARQITKSDFKNFDYIFGMGKYKFFSFFHRNHILGIFHK